MVTRFNFSHMFAHQVRFNHWIKSTTVRLAALTTEWLGTGRPQDFYTVWVNVCTKFSANTSNSIEAIRKMYFWSRQHYHWGVICTTGYENIAFSLLERMCVSFQVDFICGSGSKLTYNISPKTKNRLATLLTVCLGKGHPHIVCTVCINMCTKFGENTSHSLEKNWKNGFLKK